MKKGWRKFSINVYNNVSLYKYCDAVEANNIVQEFNEKTIYHAKEEVCDCFDGDKTKEYMRVGGALYEFINDANKYQSLLYTCCWIMDNQVKLNDVSLDDVYCLKPVNMYSAFMLWYNKLPAYQGFGISKDFIKDVLEDTRYEILYVTTDKAGLDENGNVLYTGYVSFILKEKKTGEIYRLWDDDDEVYDYVVNKKNLPRGEDAIKKNIEECF